MGTALGVWQDDTATQTSYFHQLSAGTARTTRVTEYLPSASPYVLGSGRVVVIAHSPDGVTPRRVYFLATGGAPLALGLEVAAEPAAPAFDGNLMYLVARPVGDASAGYELYRTDGSPTGTWSLGDLCPGPSSSRPEVLGASGGAFYFAAHTCAPVGVSPADLALYRTDGRTAHVVGDLSPEGRASTISGKARDGEDLVLLVDVASDGPSPGSAPNEKKTLPFVVHEGELSAMPELTSARFLGPSAHGLVLESARQPLHWGDVEPYSSEPVLAALGTFRGNLVLTTGTYGSLGVTDGTAEHTFALPWSTPDATFHAVGSASAGVVFGVQVLDPHHVQSLGREVWVSDGSAGGTVRLATVGPGQSIGEGERTPAGRLLFQVGKDVWRTDGTSVGTRRVVTDIQSTFAVEGENVYFSRLGRGVSMWDPDAVLPGPQTPSTDAGASDASDDASAIQASPPAATPRAPLDFPPSSGSCDAGGLGLPGGPWALVLLVGVAFLALLERRSRERTDP
jgi:ELWxxDGT repeat protein